MMQDTPFGLDKIPVLVPGTIDIHARPVVKNDDGSISTVASMSFGTDDGEVLIPTVAADGSRVLSEDEAIDQYFKTGQHLGIFKTPDEATAYAEALHRQQEWEYARPQQQQLRQ
jgi:hypothetical protein